MARRYTPPPSESRQFTSKAEVDRAIEKLMRRIEDVKQLEEVRYGDARVENVERDIRDTVREIFGGNSPEFHDNEYIRVWKGGQRIGMSAGEVQSKFKVGIPQTVTILEGLVRRLSEKLEDLQESPPAVPQQQGGSLAQAVPRTAFIVHGHNEGMKQSVARTLEQLDLIPIILHEQPDEGRTIIEKFEAYSAVPFAVILASADDRGCRADQASDGLRPRARQNVIFEMGWFCGKLGRRHVCVLYEEGVEIPSDYSGVLYLPFDAVGAWRFRLAKEIAAAGIPVDLNRLL